MNNINYDLISKWLTAWSISRKLPLPVKYTSGFKVDVGYEKQLARYVFPKLNEDFVHLSQIIKEPWVFLKVCASPNEIKKFISGKWTFQPQGYMMYCDNPMEFNNDKQLSNNYKLEFENYDSTYIVRIIDRDNELAAIGHLIIVKDTAVYDRIVTEPNHRRKGLASIVIKELEKIAISKEITNNFLVATEEGKKLYESVGWKLYCLYTSIVIMD